MPSSTFRVLAGFVICLLAGVGCNRSDTVAVARAKAEAEAARAEADAARVELAKIKAGAAAEADVARSKLPQPAPPSSVDGDRKAAEWALKVGGAVRVAVDGVPQDVPKGGRVPPGDLKLILVEITNCRDATDDGVDYVRRVNGHRNFVF